MRKSRLLPLFAVLAFAAVSITAQTVSGLHFDGKSWWDHVKFLADDSLEGRDTGSAGLRKAEAYAVEQFKKDGLEPAGVDGFYQPVKFNQYQVDESNSALALVRNGVTTPLSFTDDGFFTTRTTHASVNATGPLVFVGYGLRIPEKNLDEFANLDVKGKVVVYIAGSPSDIPTPLAAHSSSTAERMKVLQSLGVAGVVSIANPASMDIPWSRISINHNQPSMDLADPRLSVPTVPFGVAFNPAAAEKLFEGSGHTFGEIAGLAKDRQPLPHFPLAVSLQAKAAIVTKSIESANVIGKSTGSDPDLKNEFVVLSAHIDHIGIGAPVNGDRIYNGAMDNGSGTALVMDIAESLRTQKLRRSVLFLLVTAEEKGLLGSNYFAGHPTVPAKSLVADINTDMFLPIVPFRIAIIQGIGESDLGTWASDVARSMDIKPVADPEPLRNVFVRSDQYNFVKRGIPAVMPEIGYEPDTPEQKLFNDWLTHRYHAPSDDVNQPIDLKSAASFEEYTRRLFIKTANADARPEWKPDSFFRRYANQ